MCFGTNTEVSSGIGYKGVEDHFSWPYALLNVGGYLPIIGAGFAAGVITTPIAPYIAAVGVIAAIVRIWNAFSKANDDDIRDNFQFDDIHLPSYQNQFARGVAELACLGPLLLVADIIVTIWNCASD